jgi:predicted RNA binding protein YcfA (HicA-like mRNA interferase family)
MKIPRDISGESLIKILKQKCGYSVINQEGSHVTLETDSPSKHRITIPKHPFIKIGTLNNILKAISKHKNTTKEDLIDLFS